MAGVREKDLPKLSGFPGGVDNVSPEQDLPRNEDGIVVAARAVQDFDLVGPSRNLRLRQGYTRVAAGRAHSPGALRKQPYLFAVLDGDLRAWSVTRTSLTDAGVVRAAVGGRYLTYAQVHDDLYWSSPTELRRIRGADLTDLPAWIDCPGTPQAEPYAEGGLPAGTYRLAMTWLDADGRESGALGLVEVALQAGQGIRVFGIPGAPEGAASARVYLTPPNGEELYAVADLHPSVTQTLLGAAALNDAGRALETLWHQPLPPCETLRYWNGRLLAAERNLLRWSPALRVGLTHHDNYMRFGLEISLLEPLGEGGEGAGVWIADHKNVYWMAGDKPDAWRRLLRRDAAAVPGTSLVVPGTALGLETSELVAYWLGRDGVFCAGLPGGQLIPLKEDSLALPEGEHGATLYRASEGLRALVTSFITRGANGMAIGDRASATVTTHP